MSARRGLVLCACGAPAARWTPAGKPRRCVECSNRVVAQAAREMHAKAGPAYDAWLASSGDQGWARARQSPRVHAARLANLAKAQAVNAARRAAKASPAAVVPVAEPLPVPPPSAPRVVPPVVFRAPV